MFSISPVPLAADRFRETPRGTLAASHTANIGNSFYYFIGKEEIVISYEQGE